MKQLILILALALPVLLVSGYCAAQTKKPVKQPVKKAAPKKRVQTVEYDPGTKTRVAVEGADTVEIGHSNEAGVMPPAETPTAGMPASPKDDTGTLMFTKIEVEAGYPDNWQQFLMRHLHYVTPAKNGPKPGTYEIKVEIIIDQYGGLKNSRGEYYGIRPITAFGFGMEEEAVRVIKKSSGWKPAQQNGQPVKSYKTVVIKFVILGEE